MNISPSTYRILSFLSSAIWAVVDATVHQVILSLVLVLFSKSLEFEVRVFMTGIVVLCFAFSGLYSLKHLNHSLTADFARAGVLIVFLSVLFAVCNDEPVPLSPVIISLALFASVSIFTRYSLRHVLAEGMQKFFRLFGARAAYAAERPSGEIDTSS